MSECAGGVGALQAPGPGVVCACVTVPVISSCLVIKHSPFLMHRCSIWGFWSHPAGSGGILGSRRCEVSCSVCSAALGFIYHQIHLSDLLHLPCSGVADMGPLLFSLFCVLLMPDRFG